MMQASRPDIFHAVADINRRRLLDLLMEKEKPVQDLVPHLDMTFQGVSQHLKILSEAGLVSWRKEGRFRFYRLEPDALRDVYRWVSRYQKFWNRRLDRLGRYLDESES